MDREIYEVSKDRFHLEDQNLFILQGTWPRNAQIEAYADDQQLEARTELYSMLHAQERFRDEDREAGRRISAYIRLPEEDKPFRTLSVYYRREGGKRGLWYRVSGEEISKKRGRPQYFIELEQVQGSIVRVRGWAVASLEVEIRLLDAAGAPLPCEIKRQERADVNQVFWEAAHPTVNAGFSFEIPRPKGNHLVIEFTSEGKTAHYVVSLTRTGILCAKVSRLSQKGIRYLKKKGIRSFAIKTVDKLRNYNKRPPTYPEWLPKHLPSKKDLAEQRKVTFSYSPLISIIVPVYKTPETYLKRLIETIEEQTYSRWELCISDGSGCEWPGKTYLAHAAAKDSRIKVITQSAPLRISSNTNAAIGIAQGEYLAFADHDDELTPNALYEVVKKLNDTGSENASRLRLIYSDEDKMFMDGSEFFQPHFKPDYNRHLLCSMNYICHFLVVETSLAKEIGLFREDFDGAQDYDFILRCTESLNSDLIGHVPKILYHWRAHEDSTAENPQSKMYAFDAGKRAIEAHYNRVGVKASVFHGEHLGLYRTKMSIEGEPLVSILIPNKDHIDDLKRCMASLDEQSDYHHYEYVIIENNSEKEETFAYYETLQKERDNVRVVTWNGPFNFAAINNFGVRYARGDFLLLLNNDTQAIHPDCLRELLGFCMEKDVGAVGARLYYEDGTIQHAGVVIGFGGIAGHCFVMQPPGETGYMNRIICTAEYSAVTAACMMVRKSAFLEVGGMTEELAVAFNDIDFCLKLRRAGYLIVYNPFAELYHYESKSRGLEDTPEKLARFNREIAIFDGRWPDILRNGDPYYNPNLTLESQDFSLRRL